MKKKLEGKNETQTLQTKKPMEKQGPAIDETVREYQTDCGTVQILDPMPSKGHEENTAHPVAGGGVNVLASGSDVPMRKKTWDYTQPSRAYEEEKEHSK